jgi:hypothetical protein
MHWSTMPPAVANKAKDKVGYQFTYDNKGQLTAAQWGRPDFSANTFTGAGNKFKLGEVSYDANGNIMRLQRYNVSGQLSHNFGYNYQYQEPGTTQMTNQLSNIGGYSNYQYDALGQLRQEDALDGRPDQYIRYDVSGKVKGVYCLVLK